MKFSRAVSAAAAVLTVCLAAGAAWAQSPGGRPGPHPGPVPGVRDVSIRKTGGGVVSVGQATTFTIAVTNTGPAPVGHVVVIDPLPANLGAPVSFTYSGAGWSCALIGASVNCHYTGPTVAPGASFPAFAISATGKAAGAFSNCARVTLIDGQDMNPGNNRSCVEGVVRPLADQVDLGIAKTGPGAVVAGQTASFTLTAYNVGSGSVAGGSGIQVIDTLPAGFTGPVSASGAGWSCAVAGLTVTCAYNGPAVSVGGNLPPITVSARAGGQRRYANCATVAVRRGRDSNPGNNRSCVEGPITSSSLYDVGVRKTGPGTVSAGQTASFTLSPFNTGPSPVNSGSGVSITDTLPANFVGPVNAGGAGWTCTVAGSGPYLVTCGYVGPPVAAGGVMPPITITAVAKGTGGYVNCASIAVKAGQDVRPGDNRGCVGGEIKPGEKGYDVALRKTGPSSLVIGQAATFTLAPYNKGPSAVNSTSGVVVTDTLPSNFSPPMTVAQGPGWTCAFTSSGLTLTCHYTGVTVGPGQPLPPITVTATASGPGGYVNCATISLTAGPDLKPGDNRSCVEGGVQPGHKKQDLAFAKTAVAAPWINPGVGQFHLVASNVGNTTFATGQVLRIRDFLPAGMGLVTASAPWTCTSSAGPGGTTIVDCQRTLTAPLAPGQSLALDMNVLVSGPPRDSYENCAGVAATAGASSVPLPETSFDNNNACARVVVKAQVIDLGIRKTGPGPLILGQTATFVLHPVNKAATPLPAGAGVIVTDILPSSFSPPVTAAGGPDWSCTVTGLSVSCAYMASMPTAPGQPLPPITITAVAGKAGSFQNCARVEVKIDFPDAHPGDNQHCVPVVITAPYPFDLGIRKTGPGSLSVGQTGTYILTPFNNAATSLALTTPPQVPLMSMSGIVVEVTDTLPPTFIPPVTVNGGPDWDCTVTGLTLWCTYTGTAVFGPGQSLPAITVTAVAGKAGAIPNCASVDATLMGWHIDLNQSNNKSCVPVMVGPGGKNDVAIKKSAVGGPWAWPGGTGQYQVTITNTGSTPVPAGYVFEITETIPAGMTVLGWPGPWSCNQPVGVQGPAQAVCTYVLSPPSALPPGGSTSAWILVGFHGDKRPDYANCVDLRVLKEKALWPEVNHENNRDCEPVEVVGRGRYDVMIEKKGAGPLIVGQTATFGLYPANVGPAVITGASGLVVTDTLPASFASPATVNAGPDWACTVTGLTVSCSYVGAGSFGPNQGLPPINISAVATVAGPARNCARISLPTASDLTPGDNQDCVPVTIRPGPPPAPPALTISKAWYFNSLPDCYYGADTTCSFSITITNTGSTSWTGPLQFTDTVLPQGAVTTSWVGGQPSGWTCAGGQPLVCATTQAVTLAPGASTSVALVMAVTAPVVPAQNCASLAAPVQSGPSCVAFPASDAGPPSFEIEKVVEQDCTGSAPNTLCKFMVRIFNTGQAAYSGPLSFTDLVTSSGNPTGGVILAAPLPSGWTCTGVQPVTCSANGVTLAPGAHITIPLWMTINGPVPPDLNCATLSGPLPAGPSCVPMGHTHHDLGLDSNFLPVPAPPGARELSYWIASTPALPNGSQVILNGSLTSPAPFTPWTVVSAGWSCGGSWASFQCVHTVGPGSFTGAFLALRLRTTYPSSFSGQAVTYVGAALMNNNLDPVASNSTRTVTSTLP